LSPLSAPPIAKSAGASPARVPRWAERPHPGWKPLAAAASYMQHRSAGASRMQDDLDDDDVLGQEI
jgi:hypothetical protein